MEELKLKQKSLYDSHVVKLDAASIGLDKLGFSFGIRLKEKKLKKILDSLNITAGAVALDVGCRDGRLLNKLNAHYGTKGTGIDISSEQLKENCRYNPFGNIYHEADAEELPFKDNFFDFVFCLDVLEHLPHPEKCLAECARVLKNGAKALFYVINRNDKYTWHWFLRKISGGRLGVDRGEFGDHDQRNFLRAEEIKKACTENNLNIIKIYFFHSFFTLAFDEIWLKFLHFIYKKSASAKKSKPPAAESMQETKLPISKMVCAYLADSLLPVLEWADKPWAVKGYSNGFFVIAEKPYGKI